MAHHRVVLCAALLLVVSCGGDHATGPAISFNGTWNLRTLNGLPLPFAAMGGGGTSSTITGATLVLTPTSSNSSGTYEKDLSFTFTQASGQTTAGVKPELGTWSASGGSITFNDQTDQLVYQGSVVGNTLTALYLGGTYVFLR